MSIRGNDVLSAKHANEKMERTRSSNCDFIGLCIPKLFFPMKMQTQSLRIHDYSSIFNCIGKFVKIDSYVYYDFQQYNFIDLSPINIIINK